jgi:hypothetical protein
LDHGWALSGMETRPLVDIGVCLSVDCTFYGTVRANSLETGRVTLQPCRITKHSLFR